MTTTPKIGDWVTAYSAGFFRVEKIIRRFYDESHEGGILGQHKIGEEFEPLVVLKRGFNKNLKPSISWDSCAASLCRPVPAAVLRQIEAILLDNSKLSNDFNAFQIPSLTLCHNLRIRISGEKDKDRIRTLGAFVENGRVFRDIRNKMVELGVDCLRESRHNASLQFICRDYESIARRLVFRETKLIELGS